MSEIDDVKEGYDRVLKGELAQEGNQKVSVTHSLYHVIGI
jgi:hypothetical protein